MPCVHIRTDLECALHEVCKPKEGPSEVIISLFLFYFPLEKTHSLHRVTTLTSIQIVTNYHYRFSAIILLLYLLASLASLGGIDPSGRDSKEEPRFTLVYATLRPSHTMHGRVSPLSVQFD